MKKHDLSGHIDFAELLKQHHGFKFPIRREYGSALADSGLYEDRSDSGLTMCENDHYEMLQWLSDKMNVDIKKPDQLGMPVPRQREYAHHLIESWEQYKLTQVVTRNLPWVHQSRVHTALVAGLATDFSDATLHRTLHDSTFPDYLIREAKKAESAGVGIHQAYGSYENMVRKHYSHQKDLGVTGMTKVHFVIAVRDMIRETVKPSEDAWQRLAETYLIDQRNPDYVDGLYKQLIKLPMGDIDGANTIYNEIRKSDFRLGPNGKIVHVDSATYEVDDEVSVRGASAPCRVTEVGEKGLTVNTDNGEIMVQFFDVAHTLQHVNQSLEQEISYG